MQTRTHNPFTTIHTEGALLPTDLLQRVLSVDRGLDGLSPADYHLPAGEKLNEAINHSWDRLEGVEIGNSDGYLTGRHWQEAESAPPREVITITPEKKEEEQAAPPKAAPRPAVKAQKDDTPAQPSFTDFGLYKCESCGKMVMGFKKEKHAEESHRGKSVEWKKLR